LTIPEGITGFGESGYAGLTVEPEGYLKEG
jgi:hypothetical protein